tara:strand:+ start:275 stop:1924 length:1650 start_codon:yes stop_codon:yes gene_type:complete
MSIVDGLHFKRAVNHISVHSDTDIFPNPIEKYLFFDQETKITDILTAMSAKMNKMGTRETAAFIRENFHSDSIISPSGFTGFRLATQIDQIWNAYLLGLVLSIGASIESRRISTSKEVVFSYRFDGSHEKNIFNRDIGWRQFQEKSLEYASNTDSYSHVVSCDISDFYARIYHHSLENELLRACGDTAIVKQIIVILTAWSKGASYGLPVGGDAARLLAEAMISPLDSTLLSAGFTYCRFVDDFRIFAKSREEAQAAWVYLSEKLLKTEGLQLQKYKTIIETTQGFKNRVTTMMGPPIGSGEAGEESAKEAAFLAIHVHYDPYSSTAEEDYETLSKEIQKHDVLGLINSQLNRSRVDQSLFKKLLKAIKFLPVSKQHMLCISLLRSPEPLYPIFNIVLRVVRECMNRFDQQQQEDVHGIIIELLELDSYVLKVPIIRIYALRLLVRDNSHDADRILSESFDASKSPSLRRDIILINAVRRNTAWLKGIKIDYSSLSQWEKTAFSVASYYMDDEGKHWRYSAKNNFTGSTKVLCDWIESKNISDGWEMPL